MFISGFFSGFPLYPLRLCGESSTMPKPKSISRSLGEFLGHIFRGVRTKVDEQGRVVDPKQVNRTEVRRTVEEEKQGEHVILRRTTIEEVEVRKPEADSE